MGVLCILVICTFSYTAVHFALIYYVPAPEDGHNDWQRNYVYLLRSTFGQLRIDLPMIKLWFAWPTTLPVFTQFSFAFTLAGLTLRTVNLYSKPFRNMYSEPFRMSCQKIISDDSGDPGNGALFAQGLGLRPAYTSHKPTARSTEMRPVNQPAQAIKNAERSKDGMSFAERKAKAQEEAAKQAVLL